MFFRRKARREAASEPTTTAEHDALVLGLLQGDWLCACCGERHSGVMDLAARAPDPWPHARDHEPNAALRTEGDFLSEDFCVLSGEHFFVRALLELPVRGLDQTWGFGCWSTLSRTNFDKYVEGFDSGLSADDGPWFGWLCNRLDPLFIGTDPIGVDVFPQPGRGRPKLLIRDESLPLARIQRDGMTPEDLLAVLSASGHGPTLQ